MAVMRLPSSVVLETGEAVTVLAENFGGFQPAFFLCEAGDAKDDKPPMYLRVVRDHLDGNMIGLWGWGAGTRALFLTTTVEGKPTGQLTPVIALLPTTQNNTSGPLLSTVIESAVDPVLIYAQTTKTFTLYYWVNAWSPVSPQPIPDTTKTLFDGVKPPLPILGDYNYFMDASYRGPQPEPRFTCIRDVPNWYFPGTAPENPIDPNTLRAVIPPVTTYPERLGPIDTTRFWIAPFTDAHLFRFPKDYDPFPTPPSQPPVVPSGPPGPPPLLPPPIATPPANSFVANFPFLTFPFNDTTRLVNTTLWFVKNGFTIRPSDRSTLDTYVYALNRLAALARCSRILMRTTGKLVSVNIKEDTDLLQSSTTPVANPIQDQSQVYLVVDQPQPIIALPRGINKVLVSRPKMTSFLGLDFFVTAALTYRYPAAATVSLCAGNPQVDFIIQCPSDKFDEYRRMGILPESPFPQTAPPTVGSTIIIPGAYGSSLIEVLSNLSIW